MKKTLLLLFFFIVVIYSLPAQILADSITTTKALVNHSEVEALRISREVPYQDIKQNNQWQPYDSTYTTTKDLAVWLRFNLENTTEDTISTHIFTKDQYTDIYIKSELGTEHLKNGHLVSLSDRDNKTESYFTEIVLPPSQKSVCFIKLANDYYFSNPNPPILYSRINYLDFVYNALKSEAKSVGFIYFYLITLSCIFIFVLVFWMRLQQRLYFYYLGYLFFQIVYALLVLSSTSASVANFFLYVPSLSRPIFDSVQFTFVGFYIFFILHLLEIHKRYKILSKVLYYFGIFCFVYAVAHAIFNYYFIHVDIGVSIFSIIRFIVLPLNFILIIWILYEVRHPLLKYFVVGQTLFFIGSVLSFYLAYTERFLEPDSIFNFPYALNIIFQIGLLGEVFCFSIAIGENIFLLQKDKELMNEKLIDQLQQNRVLQENMNVELDKKVNEKTDELIQLYSEIEKQKEAEIKSSFTRRIQDMEMLALQSQMNPHFIFNTLNALKNLIMKSRIDNAVVYLDDFSELLRSILQNSAKNIITLEEELEILELYLSLEKNRIGDSFNYSIKAPSREDLSQYTIPPLLLQPFVENAIWHGLNPSEKPEKWLNISFDTSQNLKIIIEDNGIGRIASGKTEKMHKSMGTDITKERLSLYNHTNDTKVLLTILDIEEEGIPQGTRITLTYNN